MAMSKRMRMFTLSVAAAGMLTAGCDRDPQTQHEKAVEAQVRLEEAREEAAESVSKAEAEAVAIIQEAREEAKDEVQSAKRKAADQVREAEEHLQEQLQKLSDAPLQAAPESNGDAEPDVVVVPVEPAPASDPPPVANP